MALFTVPSPLAFARSLFSRTSAAETTSSPAPFVGEIIVIQSAPAAALPKPALVTPYAGHVPSVRRGKGGRFESLRPVSSAVPADLADMRALLSDPNHVWTF